jgi:hypothetical protein
VSLQHTSNSRHQLNREALAEIIRANVAAFKDDPNFYDYLTELVIYLMEYEYAWPAEALPTASECATVRPDGTSSRVRFEFIQPVNLNSPTALKDKRLCRLCGADMQGKLVCPNCLMRNRRD